MDNVSEKNFGIIGIPSACVQRYRDSVPIMRMRKRHLFYLQKTIELSYWLDKISFRTAPPTEIFFLYSQVIF